MLLLHKKIDMTKKGKFIVLYGINNLGKTTQARLLVEKMNKNGFKAEYLKYPIYDLEPSGQMLNNYLREGNTHNLSPREAQIIYTQNRTQYENKLIQKLQSGINIVAEDYTGTGIAWGIGAGVEELFLKSVNSHLLKEDISFLFDGKRFTESTEKNHKHETNDMLMAKVRQAHQKLALEQNWIKINANLTIEEIHNLLWKHVFEKINQKNSSDIVPDFKYLYEKNMETPVKNENKKKLIVEKINQSSKLPTKAHDSDAGYDLYSATEKVLFPEEISSIHTGIKIKIPTNYAGLIWDKSGLAKKGLKTMGGVIDSGYRGEIIIVIKNVSNEVINIEKGQKIAQILIQKIKSFDVIEGNVENDSTRGDGGFGSSGLF